VKRLDVVIVNFRSAKLIGRALEAVAGFANGELHCILVDNAPGDGAAEAAASVMPTTVVSNPENRGFAAAVNQAVELAEAEVVVLLNPDISRIDGSASEVLERFGDPAVAAVVTRLANDDASPQPSYFREPRPFDMLAEDLSLHGRFPGWRRPRSYRMLDRDHNRAGTVDVARGAFLFIRRAAFADVGMLDERFFVYYEETDWLIRAKRRGWQTVFLPTVEATHASAGSSPDVRSRPSLLLLESQHRYARKHFGPVTAAFLRTALVGIDTARLTRHALAGSAARRAEALDRIRVHLTLRAPRPS
jgi:N-acetylglucosaminyl-diphospho-decaprenol L-rhamnosyltransferase